MVQRKVLYKLGVLPDHFKSKRRTPNLKPTSQHQDNKNKAADLKIKMKKSRSMKLSDTKSPRSSATKRILLPGKPPTGDVSSMVETPQKQSTNRAMKWSPNYMKSTSSADARRGISLVSSRNSHSFSDSKLFNKEDPSNSKVSSTGSKLAKTETNSMKLVRSLTKTPSFKNARSTAKKCSRVAINADMEVQKATCSSTMKDSNFPRYLVLNPGGTESKGTSVEKVCRYTYCSLNGHHHPAVPPLKLFLSTRRRSLKTQQSFKAEFLSRRRGKKPVHESKRVQNTLICKEEKFSCSTTFPMQEEEEMDYFIEIYANHKDDGAYKDSLDTDEMENFSFAAKPEDSNYVPYWGADVKQVAESISDGPPCSEIDFEENHEQYHRNIPAEVKIAENYPDAEKDFRPSLFHKELDPKRLVYGANSERENHKAADTSSEATNMDWEDVHLFSEADYFIKVDFPSQSELEACGKSEIKAKDTKVTSHEEIQCDEIVEYISEGESGYSDAQLVDHYPEQEVYKQDAEARSFEDEQGSPNEATHGEFVVTGEEDKLRETLVDNQNSVALTMSTEEKVDTDGDRGEEKINQDKDVADFGIELALLNAECGHQVFENEQVPDNDQTDGEVNKTADPHQITKNTENGDMAQAGSDEQNKSTTLDMCIENIYGESDESKTSNSMTSQEQNDPECNISSCYKDSTKKRRTGDDMKMDDSEIAPPAECATRIGFKGTIPRSGTNSNENLPNNCKKLKQILKRKGATEEWEEPRQFNPSEPNYLPLVPQPEAEKVDLQHQDMDYKNSEEWMLDHALQMAVNKLAPARKRKVALLVEAFETVTSRPM